jgi:hypothetical protein
LFRRRFCDLLPPPKSLHAISWDRAIRLPESYERHTELARALNNRIARRPFGKTAQNMDNWAGGDVGLSAY